MEASSGDGDGREAHEGEYLCGLLGCAGGRGCCGIVVDVVVYYMVQAAVVLAAPPAFVFVPRDGTPQYLSLALTLRHGKLHRGRVSHKRDRGLQIRELETRRERPLWSYVQNSYCSSIGVAKATGPAAFAGSMHSELKAGACSHGFAGVMHRGRRKQHPATGDHVC